MYERLSRRTHLSGQAFGSSIQKSVHITASKTSGVIAFAQNPESVPVAARDCLVHIKTGSTVACTLDIGVATTKVLADNMIDGCGTNMPANTLYDVPTDHGSNGTTRNYVPVGGYFTVAVASGDANGLVADFDFYYDLFTGGDTGLTGYQ